MFPLDRPARARLWSPGAQSRTAFRLLAGRRELLLVCRQFGCHPILSLAGSASSLSAACLRAQFAPPESYFYWHLPLGVLVVCTV